MAVFTFFPVSTDPDLRNWNMLLDRETLVNLILQSPSETTSPTFLRLNYDSMTVTFSGTGLSFVTDAGGEISDIPTGSFTGLRIQLDDGRVLLDATGFDLAGTAFALLLQERQSGPLYDLMLVGNDRITGGRFADSLSGHTGEDRLVGGDGRDDLYGGVGRDTLNGGNGRDVLFGGDDGDRLEGGAGNDTLDGGFGRDNLIGGVGRDEMTGGLGADRFIWRGTADSGATVERADFVVDFNRGQDRIDLSRIDALATTAEDNAFVWAGMAAFGSITAGEVRYELQDLDGTASDRTVVWIDTDGDAAAEMAILLNGLHSLTAADFLL